MGPACSRLAIKTLQHPSQLGILQSRFVWKLVAQQSDFFVKAHWTANGKHDVGRRLRNDAGRFRLVATPLPDHRGFAARPCGDGSECGGGTGVVR
jgi:hypothetical protein